MLNIPKRVINEIKEADRLDSKSFLKSDVKYLKMLAASNYIRITYCTDFDTPDGYDDYGVSILKSID